MNPSVCIPAAVQLLTYSSTYPVRTSLYLLLPTALCILDFSLRETAKPPSNEILSGLPCISLTSSTCLYNSRLLWGTTLLYHFLSALFPLRQLPHPLLRHLQLCHDLQVCRNFSLSETRARVFLDIPHLRPISSLSPIFIFRALSIIRHWVGLYSSLCSGLSVHCYRYICEDISLWLV